MTAPALTLELLYAEPVTPDHEALAAELPPTSRLAGEGMIVHDGSLTTHITASARRQVIEREHDFSQTWGWPEAREVVARATACVAVVEMMGFRADPEERVRAFGAVVQALVRTTEPLALWCPNITKFVPPAHADGLEPFINVRLFRVENGREGEMVMDSLGLHAFDLPDVQCHFRGIEPGEMAPVLYNTAAYLLERGDVIEDGNTISGPRGDERWHCRHEAALIGPERAVLDVDPGAPHAAGTRAAAPKRGWLRRRG